MNRREFITGAVATAAASAFGVSGASTNREMKAVLLYLGENYRRGWLPADINTSAILGTAMPALKVTHNEKTWRHITDQLVASGCNTVVLGLAEALAYPSHPELAVEGSWSPKKMRNELARLRTLGLEPIPGINFSATHDSWLKDYHRMVSTTTYYRVCSDIIRDVTEIFDHPRFIHLGYDEETFGHQAEWGGQEFAVIRAGEMWWHDFLWFVKEVEKNGCRPWIWSDRGWHHDDFVKRCPKSVLQSNWYYDENACGFNLDSKDDYTRKCLRLYLALDKAGFEQVPCGSNWNAGGRKKKGFMKNETFPELVKFARKNIVPERLKGFIMASWQVASEKDYPKRTLEGIELVRKTFS